MATMDVTTTLLHVSRRVDWRFLLPDPILENVCCLEPIAPSLAEALQTFSASLTRLPGQEDGNERRRRSADLLVASDPSRQAFKRATGLLKPGAHVYIEARGLLPRLKQRRRASVADDAGSGALWRPPAYARFLRELGFTAIESYWHWPNFEGCKMMIPLQNHAAARLAFARGGQSLQARLQAGLGRIVVSVGLLAWTVPYFSVIARWEQP